MIEHNRLRDLWQHVVRAVRCQPTPDPRLNELKVAWEQWLEIPFPHESDDRDLSVLHGDLVLFDDYVAGGVLRILKGMSMPEGGLVFRDDLIPRLDVIMSKCLSAEDEARARNYRDYLDGLRALFDTAKQTQSSMQLSINDDPSFRPYRDKELL